MKQEKDLGVIIQENIKIGNQVAAAALAANMMLGMIQRSLVNCEEKMTVRLYKTFVGPHLEFAIVAWSPHMVNDISNIEKDNIDSLG